ncbi:glycoside hydrolase family 16 protein [Nitratireductor luteus]|uniref:endo-1,3-1,4-beta-glycanase ExoK n=1 Tax=Nitratireductor luteus TaxID=2976980 RepID=UPI00223F91B9
MTLRKSANRKLLLPLALLCVVGAVGASHAQQGGASFVEEFDRIDGSRWYISDGWANGAHQNCTWSKDQVTASDGILRLGFTERSTGDRDYACGEIQTNTRFSYGTYEARIQAVAGSGMNTGFFTYIGPAHGQPWDEIDFEFLGKDPSKVQLNQYVSGKGGNEKLVPVPGGAHESFNDYAFVWEKDRIRWFINGELVHEVNDPDLVPSQASKIYLSLWASDNMESWLGPFEQAEGTLSAQVERVAFTALGDACQFPESVACTLD